MYLYCTEKPGSKWPPLWKLARAEKKPQKISRKCGCVEHQYQLTSISGSSLEGVVQREIFITPVGLQEEKILCWFRVKPCSQLSCALVFPFPRVREAAELLCFSCVSISTSVSMFHICDSVNWSRLGREARFRWKWSGKVLVLTQALLAVSSEQIHSPPVQRQPRCLPWPSCGTVLPVREGRECPMRRPGWW